MKKVLMVIVVVLMMATLFAAAQREVETKPIYLASSIRNLANAYHFALAEGARLFARSIGQEGYFQVLASEGSSEKQLNDIKALVAKSGGNAVFHIDPNEAIDVIAIARELTAAKCYFVTNYNKPEDVDVADYPYWVTHMGVQSEGCGYATAKALLSKIGGRGKVFVLRGMLGNNADIERYAGFERALKEFPNVQVIGWESADWLKQRAYNIVSNKLISDPDLAAIWSANDDMAAGAIEALRAKGLNGKVVVTGADATPEMLDLIKKGDALMTASADPYWQAGIGLAMAYAAQTGKLDVAALPATKRNWRTPMVMVDASNVDEMLSMTENPPKIDYTDFWGRWSE
ncbi:MAG: sugar ABC transporter substrate-binding protein [Sphaerochaetaceae bacterium]